MATIADGTRIAVAWKPVTLTRTTIAEGLYDGGELNFDSFTVELATGIVREHCAHTSAAPLDGLRIPDAKTTSMRVIVRKVTDEEKAALKRQGRLVKGWVATMDGQRMRYFKSKGDALEAAAVAVAVADWHEHEDSKEERAQLAEYLMTAHADWRQEVLPV